MTYDSSAFEEEVIIEVASAIVEGLVTSEGWDWEKGKLKICWYMGGLTWVKFKNADHYTIQALL